MIDPEIKSYVDQRLNAYQTNKRYSTKNASAETHNGLDAPNIAKLNQSTSTSGTSISIGGFILFSGTGIGFSPSSPTMPRGSIISSSSSASSIQGRSHGGTNTLLSSSLSGRKVELDTNDFANGITWDATGHGFICVTAGYYQVNGMILFTTGVIAGDQLVCNIDVNGSTISSNTILHTSTGQNSLNINDIVHLNVSDEVYLYAGDCSGHDVNYDSSSQYTFLSIAKV